MIDSTAGLTIQKIGGNIGAEIGGVDLADPISEAVAAAIRDALWKHKVIFFRGQHRVDDDAQTAFAERIGDLTLTAHPTHAGLASRPKISTLDSLDATVQTDHWHTDSTFVDRPPAGAVLRAVVLPSHGGDTLWANAASAYQSMPDEMRVFIDGLWGAHSTRSDYGHLRTKQGLPPLPEESPFAATAFYGPPFETIHPLVRVHPHTGERSILAGSHLRYIVGLPPSSSYDIRRLLSEFITRPEHTVRWRWQLGDIAVWDNQATQHYAARDYTEKRLMHRVSLAGDAPVGVDGRRSWARVGDVSSYTPIATPARAGA